MDSSSASEASDVIESEHHHHHHGQSGVQWFDAAMTVSVLLVSVASVLISLHTGSAMNNLVQENARLVRASSTPLLDFQTGNATSDGKKSISFTLSNSGTGPARIDWLELRYNGTAQPNMMALNEAVTGVKMKLIPVTSQASSHTLLRAGEDRTFLRWAYPEPGNPEMLSAWNAMNDGRFSIEPVVCYCSLLDECWQANLRTNEMHRVDECRPQDHVIFGDLFRKEKPKS